MKLLTYIIDYFKTDDQKAVDIILNALFNGNIELELERFSRVDYYGKYNDNTIKVYFDRYHSRGTICLEVNHRQIMDYDGYRSWELKKFMINKFPTKSILESLKEKK